MTTTGQRGGQRPHPGNTTGMAFYRQQRDQDAKRKAEAQTVDLAEIRRQARMDGIRQGFENGADWAFGILRDAGVDVDAVLALDADEPGEDA